jgi:hypothetical protein
MAVRVHAVASARDLARFVELPWRLYRGDSAWVPPLRRDVRARFDRAKEPFYEHGDAQPFLALESERAVGRIAAVVNSAHNDFHRDRVGFFGFFECEDDPAAARALFDAAASWVGERGMTALRGPASFSMNDECGSLTSGFEDPPTILMPYNPAYHARLYEAAGFSKAKDLFAYWIDAREAPERMERVAAAARARNGLSVRSARMKTFDREVDEIWRIYNDAWQRNWGFVPMSRGEMTHMARELRPVVDPELLLFAETGGEAIAFALALPDWNQALRHANGRLLPLGWLKIWWHSRRIRRARVITLGVVEGHRSSGADVVLFHELLLRGRRKGLIGGELSWVLEDNVPMRRPIERAGGRIYKSYRIYERPIAERPIALRGAGAA